MNSSRKGNQAEVFVAKWLQDHGWLVASRRHIGGAGDLLAVRNEPFHALPEGAVWLLEVKSCKEVWQQFRREDRKAMRDTPLPPGGERWVVNKRGKELIWVAEKDWPPNDYRAGKPNEKDIARGEELAKEQGWP